jgi:hypothetical protein
MPESLPILDQFVNQVLYGSLKRRYIYRVYMWDESWESAVVIPEKRGINELKLPIYGDSEPLLRALAYVSLSTDPSQLCCVEKTATTTIYQSPEKPAHILRVQPPEQARDLMTARSLLCLILGSQAHAEYHRLLSQSGSHAR